MRLDRLLAKYRTLGELRRAHSRGEPRPERDVFRRLAREFPGALEELDRLPMDEIDRREQALAEVLAGTRDAEPWMEWMHQWHAILRAALAVKARVGKRKDVQDEEAASLAAIASDLAGAPLDQAFVRAVARPPGGRVTAVVLARLSEATGRPPLELARALMARGRAVDALGAGR